MRTLFILSAIALAALGQLSNSSCSSGYSFQNGACKKIIDQSCTSTSECFSSTGIVCTQGKCQCDRTKGFAGGNAGDISCVCSYGYAFQNRTCKKVIGHSCTSTSDCYTSAGILCTLWKCECDKRKHYAAGRYGATSCDCAPGYSLQNGTCICSSGYSMEKNNCKCDLGHSFHNGACTCSLGYSFLAGYCSCYIGSSGVLVDITDCTCKSGYFYNNRKCQCTSGYSFQNGDCKKVIDQSCASTSECYSSAGILCNGGKCQCDTANHFAAGRAGATSCDCVPGYFSQNGACKKVVDQSCVSTSECYSSSGILCTGGKCQCDTTNYFVAGTAGATSCERKTSSCVDVRKYDVKSSIHTLFLDDNKTLDVYCDQDTDGGGWMVVQRRQDGSVDFRRNWTEYERGFGNMSTEFWIGLANLHHLTKNKNLRLRVDLMDFAGSTAYAVYNTFRIGDAGDRYRLNVGGYNGTAGDSLEYHNTMQFSTFDRDHDKSIQTNCAESSHGGWWYNQCSISNLNGIYERYKNITGIIVWPGWTPQRHIKRVEMKMKE